MATFPIAVSSRPGEKGSDEKDKVELTETNMEVEPTEKALALKDDGEKPAAPQRIRIGPEKHRYYYTRRADFVYKCCRGSDYAPQGHILYLLKQEDGQWIAYDGPDTADSALPPLTDPIFTTYKDILEEGWHKWRMHKWDGRESSFKTTVPCDYARSSE